LVQTCLMVMGWMRIREIRGGRVTGLVDSLGIRLSALD